MRFLIFIGVLINICRHLQEAVVFEIVYLRAQAEAMRWKKTQSSEIYAHTTRKARTIMDDRRAHFQSKISGAKLARDRALQRLGSLPELPTRTDQLAAIKVEKETIRAYTEELKEWLEELERHRSLLKAKQEAEEAQANSSHSPETVSGIPTQPQLQTLQSFFQREKWTWKDLKEAPSLIDSAIEDAQAIIYREDYTRINELYFDDLEVLDEQLPPIAADEGTPVIENQRFVPRIEANGKNIDELVNRTTGLVHKIDSLKEEIEEVKKQREKMDKIYAQVRLHV
jgi:phage shock protein A